MEAAIKVLGTLVMLAVLIYAIMKNINITMAMLTIGTAAVAIISFATGTSVMGDNTTGSLLLDCFEYVAGTAAAQASGNGLIVMSVMGYVAYMQSMKATDIFALTLAGPFRKSKAKYATVAGTIIITCLLQLVVTSNAGKASLAIAVLYPVMLAAGVSTATAATAIVIGQAFTYGPGCGMTYTVFSAGGIDYSVPTFFFTKELPIFIPALIVTLIAFYFTSRAFDKKEAVTYAENTTAMEAGSIGVPRWYALLPVIPLALIIVFSGLFFDITMSVSAANFAGLFIVLLIMLMTKKDKKAVFENTKQFFSGMASSFGSVVTIMIAAALFSGAISKVGGLQIIFSAFSNAGVSVKAISIIGALLAFVFIAITGSQVGNMALFGGLFANVSQAMGANVIDMYSVLVPVGCYGMALSPVSGANLMVSRLCGVEIKTIIKRCAIPTLFCIATMTIISQFILI